MTQIIVLPHVEVCPDGAVIEAREGESICQNLLENVSPSSTPVRCAVRVHNLPCGRA